MNTPANRTDDRQEQKRRVLIEESRRITNETPILKHFKIFGLNDFKDISINFETPVKIVAADNGAGKTTVMNALYSILSNKPDILSKINYKKIEIYFGDGSSFSFLKEELFAQGDIGAAIKASKFDSFMLQSWGLSHADVHDLLVSYVSGTIEDHPHWDQIYFESPYDMDDVQGAFERLSAVYKLEQTRWSELQLAVTAALGDIDVIYLPTYRRVEADLPEYRRRQGRRRRRSLLKDPTKEREDDLINFGLGDVQEKIDRLLKEMKESTLTAYSQISRNTLQQLANKQPDTSRDKIQFEQDDIKVIFARLPEDNSAAESTVLKLIETGAMGRSENRNLRNFLSQLVDAFYETRDRERTINKFIDVVNDYLSFGFKEKELIYDKFNMRVEIKNTINNSTLMLNNLSSGEKQIVSIFSRLCLDRTKKVLILIDEPELSLSMDWQKALLPDIWLTGNCAQIVAITHSPFIFENEFDRFAGSMELSYSRRSAAV